MRVPPCARAGTSPARESYPATGGSSTVRRLVLLTIAAVLAITAVAYAVDNTVTYTSKVSFKGKPTVKKPAAATYTGILHIDTNPTGQQPETAPITSVYFAKAYKNN